MFTVDDVEKIAAGIRLARHRPTLVEAAEITGTNRDQLAEWSGGTWYMDENRILILEIPDHPPGRIGDVIIHSVIEDEFYIIKKSVYLSAYEDVVQLG